MHYHPRPLLHCVRYAKITVAVLDKFHPQIKAAIAAVSPADWALRFIEENT